MHYIDLYFIFVLQWFLKFTHAIQSNINSHNPWSCHLASEHRLECRNLYNFYFSSETLCGNDERLLTKQNIDELHLINDYNCFDHSYRCYFEIDSSWSLCLHSLRKLIIENVSFIVRLGEPRKLIPIDYLKIVNTHGSITELLHLVQLSNRSSVFIQNAYPRWSGIDLYAIYLQHSSIILKQLWINTFDWYPIIYMYDEQKQAIRQWLLKVPCLHIELGDCHSYYHDMIFLRDLFNARQESSNELYCYTHHYSERSHWSKIPELFYNYIIPRRSSLTSLVSPELQENCFDQFTKPHYTINSNTDLQDIYSSFQDYDTYSIPLSTIYPYATLPILPKTSTTSSIMSMTNRSSYLATINYINIYAHAAALNETRWLSSIATYPDGRFVIIDNRNQQLLLLNENGTYRIDLTSIFTRQIEFSNQALYPTLTAHNSYSFSHLHIDQDSYAYLIPNLAYYIYVFSANNRLVRCLTPTLLGISIIRSDCLAITHTGLIYICDDAYRVVRIYTRMGVAQKILRLDYLPLKLFISNNRMFTYSIERLASIQMYTLSGTLIRSLTMCSHDLPSKVIWFRGKYFLTCGTHLHVLDEYGEELAEQGLHVITDYAQTLVIIHDFAVNKNGLFLVTFRRNGTLFNRYWVIRPAVA